MRPQQTLWSFDVMLVCLVILTVTFFLLTIFSIIQANTALFHIGSSPVWSLKILDTSSSATLFVTVLGALLVRHQFALGVLPRIDYKSNIAVRQITRFPGESLETWRVEILNTGLGSAIINRIEYSLESTTAKSDLYSLSFGDFINELASLDFVKDRDYWIENITSGFSLSPKDNCLVFEIKTEHLKTFKRLGMALYFQGQLGDKYRGEISLLPRI